MTDPWLAAYVLTLVGWSLLIGTCYVKVVCCDEAGRGTAMARHDDEYYSLLDV